MISIDELSEKSDFVIYYHAFCTTCNDPGDTVQLLVSDTSKDEAVRVAKNHEREFGEGHSLMVSFSFSTLPDNDYLSWEEFGKVKFFK